MYDPHARVTAAEAMRHSYFARHDSRMSGTRHSEQALELALRRAAVRNSAGEFDWGEFFGANILRPRGEQNRQSYPAQKLGWR